ncbi:MAG: transporter substrate-binding domain-containing protein, partial [Hyphomicrobium sp.]|nr:transporter substrate-binding domain-containing protein [Hyphomicrobium sp.]
MMARSARGGFLPVVRNVLLLSGLLLAVALAALAPTAAISQESATGEAAETRRVVVRFLTEGDFPPFNYLDEDGVLNGFNVDLARALCNEIGAACDIRVRPWDELLVALKRG